MKKVIFTFVLGLSFCLVAAISHADQQATEATGGSLGSPVEQFTGKYWVETPETAKEAYLFGIESALEVEYYVSKKMAAEKSSRKMPVVTLSPFEKGWMKALDGVTRKEIAAQIDKWYADNPDQLARPVMNVIWYEIIKPRLDASK